MSLCKDLVGDIMKYVGTTILSPDVVDFINEDGNIAYIAINPHPSAADIVINPRTYNAQPKQVRDKYILSTSNNSQIIRFIIARPWYINYDAFAHVDNDISVRYMLSMIDKIVLDDSDDDDYDDNDDDGITVGTIGFYENIIDVLQTNPNKLAVNYFINNPNKFYYSEYKSKNPIKLCIDIKTLINSKSIKKSCIALAGNTSDIAVDYVISNIDKVIDNRQFKMKFVKNSNNKVADFIMSNFSKFSSYIHLSTNIRLIKFIKDNVTNMDIIRCKVFSNPEIFIRDPELEKALLAM